MPFKHVLWLLYVGNVLNYLDRYVLAALLDDLKKPPLHMTDTQLGWLMTGFLIVYMCASPGVAWCAQRMRVSRVLALGVGVWSVATCASAWAPNASVLLGLRACVGVGEAVFAVLAPVWIQNHVSEDARPRALGVFFMAIPVGAALGYALGGGVSAWLGWRAALAVAGVPGVCLAYVLWRVDMPFSMPSEPVKSTQVLHALVRNRVYCTWVCVYAAYTFALGGLAYWMPAFLKREHGWDVVQATSVFGLITVCTGIAGTWCGVRVWEFLRVHTWRAYVWTACISIGCALPFVCGVLVWRNTWVVVLCMVCAQWFLFMLTSPVNAAILSSVQTDQKAFAMAFSTFCIHAFGDVPSPLLIGWLSDKSSLGAAMVCVPLALGVACVVLVWGLVKNLR
jgi:predicted MFS family arabinose efflux permease